jgi:hypothetical protein
MSVNYVTVHITLNVWTQHGKDPRLENVLPHTRDVFLLDMICHVAVGRKEQQ